LGAAALPVKAVNHEENRAVGRQGFGKDLQTDECVEEHHAERLDEERPRAAGGEWCKSTGLSHKSIATPMPRSATCTIAF